VPPIFLFHAAGAECLTIQDPKIQRGAPMPIPPAQHDRHFLLALTSCEDQMRGWKNASDANSCLFYENPAAALAAADPQLELNAMLELEGVLRGLARKLEMARR
jgi:hypothetical protein